MGRTLADTGYVILEAATAAEGLSQFQQHRSNIRMAVIEMVIPGISGLDLAAELERLQPGIRILYMSSLRESIAVESIARKSPQRVLLKPFTRDELRDKVEQLLILKTQSDQVHSEPHRKAS